MQATISAAVLGLANAVLQAIAAFGVSLTDNQNAAITGLLNAALVFGFLAWELYHKTPAPPAPPPPPPTPVGA